MSERTCGTCRWWKEMPHLKRGVGQCRRYPPTVLNLDRYKPIHESENGAAWMHPATYDMHFCGEHQPQPKDTDND